MKPRALTLLGRDFPDLGPLAVVRLPDGGALALSRGAKPKSYPHTDPNEDGALLARTDRGAVLAVADGHNGAAASERALAALERAAPELLTDWADSVEQRILALVRSTSRALAEVAPSRTCLLIAVLEGTACHFASFGDSSLFRASRAAPLNISNELFLCPELARHTLPPKLWSGSFRRQPDERVALVTDGVTNFIPDPGAIHGLLRDSPDDAAAARSIAEAALTGGAGDNVAVTVFGPRLPD